MPEGTPPAEPGARLLQLGDAAWIVEFGSRIDEATHARVMGFAAALADERARGRWAGVIECVPAYTTATVFFAADTGPRASAQIELDDGAALLALARRAEPLLHPGRRWQLPVCFDADLAPDLDELAAARGLAREQVIALMTGCALRVYMLGFQPGFPYLGGLPAELELPRRRTPRTDVPARSVAVAGRMCAVYPWRSPGGWHLLGRTPLALFDATRAGDPAWLLPGDEVHWVAIHRQRFDELERLTAAGAMRREDWLLADDAGSGP